MTDSALHVEAPHAPGTFDYFACIEGQMPGEAQVCSCAYGLDGTLVVPSAPTLALRSSLGAAKARWAR